MLGSDSITSSSDTISSSAINIIIDNLRHQRHRNSTRANYYCVWKLFNKFFVKLDMKPSTWEDCLTLFVGYLIACNKKSTTVHSYISAIKSVLIENGSEIHEDKFLFSSLTWACKLKNDRVFTKLLIKKNLLQALIKELDTNLGNQPYLNILYKAMFSSAYFGLYRIIKIAETVSGHAVKAVDVHVGCKKDKLLFILHSSKMHGKGSRPQLIKIVSESKNKVGNPPTYCPFNNIKQYLAIRKSIKNTEEQFSILRDLSNVTASIFRNVLKNAITSFGFQARLYSSHSFRSGRMIGMMDMGIPFERIKKIGHWKSHAIYAYLKE